MVTLAFFNAVLWYATPWLRNGFDTLTGRLNSPYRPAVIRGVQELLLYYDPWLALGIFPAVYTVGFVAVAALLRPRSDSTSRSVIVLLCACEAVWLALIVIGICFRGRNWAFYWPWEPWDPKGVILLYPIAYSQVFQYSICPAIPERPWMVREAPGLFLALGYFILGLLVSRTMWIGRGQALASSCLVFLVILTMAPLSYRMLGRGALEAFLRAWLALGGFSIAGYLLWRVLRDGSRDADRSTGYWRYALLVILLQAAALIPLKMLLYWTLNLKYFICVPEYQLNV